jgi:hypothetical protein
MAPERQKRIRTRTEEMLAESPIQERVRQESSPGGTSPTDPG